MASSYMTPGVYIEEKNAFPGSVVAVETAIPVFIGYTEIATSNGRSLFDVPVRVSSFAEYVELFGGGYQNSFSIEKIPNEVAHSDTFKVNDQHYRLSVQKEFFLYNCIRLFYANGGASCYILSVGNYSGTVKADELAAEKVFLALEKESEPTLVVVPDAVVIAKQAIASTTGTGDADFSAFYSIYQNILAHCAKMQSRMAIFDVPLYRTDDEAIASFRTGIGTNFLNYGAAYYPWLHTNIVFDSEIDIRNIFASITTLKDILPEQAVHEILTKFEKDLQAANTTALVAQVNTNYHRALLAASPVYAAITTAVKTQLNTLPPSAAMAGIYTLVDMSRGVWKAPANVSVSNTNSPTSAISSEQQANYNVDPVAGKSINIIRPFRGIGTLVWGGRTLDGNSQDWRYINVRRTLIMMEQSIKLAMRAYVFEPNDAATWATVQSMITNFLTNLWKQGALAGANPEQAFTVAVGLGTSMTPGDILAGKMLLKVKVAIVRPAEFIVLSFEQMQQIS